MATPPIYEALRRALRGTDNHTPTTGAVLPYGRDETDDERHQRMLHEAHKALVDQHNRMMRRMALLNFLAVSCMAVAVLVNLVGGIITRSQHADQLLQLHEQVQRLERIKHYAGKDADGNEVWQASVTDVNLDLEKKP